MWRSPSIPMRPVICTGRVTHEVECELRPKPSFGHEGHRHIRFADMAALLHQTMYISEGFNKPAATSVEEQNKMSDKVQSNKDSELVKEVKNSTRFRTSDVRNMPLLTDKNVLSGEGFYSPENRVCSTLRLPRRADY